VFDDLSSKDTFRSPETLHRFLKDAAERKHVHHKRLWFLAQLIRGRAAKRLAENTQRYEIPAGSRVVEELIVWKPA
jgi:hypothetical protein